MSQTASATISYGFWFKYAYDLPWMADGLGNDYGDYEKWWKDQLSYESPFELFNEDGNWINGEGPAQERIDDYYTHRREWEKAHPMPFEVVRTGDYSGECNVIIAVPEAGMGADWNGAESFNPQDLFALDEEAVVELQTFYEAYLKDLPDHDSTMRWYLSARWF